MSTYSYLILNAAGKELKGTVEAKTRDEAIQQLKKEGQTILSLEAASALSQDIDVGFLAKKPSARDMAVFCRQFVSIINAGVPVTTALAMLSEQTENKMLAAAVGDCKHQIETGTALSEAMASHLDVFGNLFVTLVAAGEASGSLDVSFERMGIQFEKDAKIKGLIKKAAMYPCVVAVVAVVVVAVMLGFVVPQFETLLADLGGELPFLTVIVVNASNLLIENWYWVLGGITFLVFGIRYYKKTEGGGRLFGSMLIKLPLIGELTVKNASARMARTLSTLIGAGIPMIQALEITANTMGNVHFRDALINARDDVSMGEKLSTSIKLSGLFPPLVYHMLGIGEETGDIEEMMTKLAEYYEEEVEIVTQTVMAALEPMIIIVLALIVGAIAGAVMMPMMSMYQALDNL